ncbi:MAG: metal-dependent transcriptional regulator, partial [Clostridiales bacterium]|nr:metal-dependent transcriptional regulator [Clostridiales bacterium]
KNAGGVTPSLEDYLEVIFFSQESVGCARVTAIADALGVSKTSVNKAVKNLSALGLLEHEKYGQMFLTEQGKERAGKVAARHRAIQRFLSEILGVPAKQAEEEACRIEHAMSQETVQRLIEFMVPAEDSAKGGKNGKGTVIGGLEE